MENDNEKETNKKKNLRQFIIPDLINLFVMALHGVKSLNLIQSYFNPLDLKFNLRLKLILQKISKSIYKIIIPR